MKALALLQLGKKLSKDSDAVIQAVKSSIDSPDTYFVDHLERLEDRDINMASEELPWIALVDELIENELAFEIDWKEDSQTVCEVINDLLDKKGFSPLGLKEGDYEDYTTEEFLSEASIELMKRSISLAFLDINSDSYVLITVPCKEIQDLKRLAHEAGYTISDKFIN
jgi:hypothetical protein